MANNVIYQSRYTGSEIDKNITKIKDLAANVENSQEAEDLKNIQIEGKIYKVTGGGSTSKNLIFSSKAEFDAYVEKEGTAASGQIATVKENGVTTMYLIF